MQHTGSPQRITDRLLHELKEYMVVSAYLFICLSALLLYKRALLQAEGINYLSYGVAAIKALILGKFMMVGHAMQIGRRSRGQPLFIVILHKTVVFLVLLFLLNVVEEVLVGWIHGRSPSDALADFAGGTFLQILAVCLLFLLILLPYFTYREVA